MTGEDVYWASLLACCEMLHAGVTTFADMFFHEDQVAQAAVDSGIRAQVGQGIMEQLSGEDNLELYGRISYSHPALRHYGGKPSADNGGNSQHMLSLRSWSQ